MIKIKILIKDMKQIKIMKYIEKECKVLILDKKILLLRVIKLVKYH